MKNESAAFALSWTLYHVINQESPFCGLGAEDLAASDVLLVVVVTGYDVVAAQTIHARTTYDHTHIRFGQRYADILEELEGGRVRIDYGRFHDTVDAS